jgi:hypothetical protein
MTTTRHTQSAPAGAETGRRGERPVLLGAAICGVLVFAAGGLTPADGPAVETATAAQIRSYLVNHVADLRLEVLQAVLILPLMLVFGAALAWLIRNRLPRSLLADLVVMATVLVTIPPVLAAAARSMTLVQALDQTSLSAIDDDTLRGWYALTNLTHFFSDLWIVPVALLVGSYSIAALRARPLLPRWLAWAGLAIAASGAVGVVGVVCGSVPVSAFWFGGLFGWMLWTLATAVVFALRLRRADQ